jgi:putative DNA primase/helicase
VQVGRKYYFQDGAHAFTDRGGRLTTPSENTEVIRGLVAIAERRGWTDITVSGTERFRKEAWFTARLAGLEVRGYRPTEFEQERLAREAARTTRSPDVSAPSLTSSEGREAERSEPKAPGGARRGQDALLIGRLVDHGRAPYRYDPQQPLSYFATIETERGERTFWGVDIERAFKESLTQPKIADEVGLRALRQDAVTVKAPKRDANGQVIGEEELQTHRNRWIVEKREFFDARAAAAGTVRNPSVAPREAVREHPELAGTYLYIKGAEEIARRRIRDPADQQRFVETVRGALAESIARGEPLAAVRLRERTSVRAEREAPARA